MKNMNLRIFLLVITLIFTSDCMAGNENKFSAERLSWLSGCWKGTGLGGEVEECWVRSPDDKFTSVFQMVKDGQQQFSEIVMISEFDGKIGMRVKHFDAAFNQWKSDLGAGPTFPFVEMGEHYIQFEGLRYELIDTVCHVTLDMKSGDTVHQVRFVLNRN